MVANPFKGQYLHVIIGGRLLAVLVDVVDDLRNLANAAGRISVRINASIEPGINIPDTTDEVKRTVKKNIMNVIGVDVADVAVYFKHIKAKE